MPFTYPPVAFPPPPPTFNTLSSHERSALIRSSKKLYKVLGDVPHVLDDDMSPLPSRPSTSCSFQVDRGTTCRSMTPDTESAWHKRKPTHLPPLLKLFGGTPDVPDSPDSTKSPVYHRPPTHRGSVLSLSPSIVSNAPSTASGTSTSGIPSDASGRRSKLERLRRKLGHDVPATAVFPTTPTVTSTLTSTAVPHTLKVSTSSKKTRTRSVAHQADDARSIAFSISSDESVHTVTFTTRVRSGSPRPPKTKHTYNTGSLPPVPPIPSHLLRNDSGDDDSGLLRPRAKLAAGSMIGGADFKAARRAKREGRDQNGVVEPGELVEMVGFMF